MCRVADIDPGKLNELMQSGHEERNQLANRAGAVITGELRELWKDRELKVRFHTDGHHFDTFISDPNRIYDVEVTLGESDLRPFSPPREGRVLWVVWWRHAAASASLIFSEYAAGGMFPSAEWGRLAL
jgi:hypothetical protein